MRWALTLWSVWKKPKLVKPVPPGTEVQLDFNDQPGGVMTGSGAAPVQDRLTEAKASLDYLDAERLRRADPDFGRRLEDKVIWRELLELKLEDAEDRISRMCDAAERALALIR